MVKNLLANAGDEGDLGLIPGSGRSPGGRNGNPLQYSCLENPRGQRSLVGYSPRGHKESDMTENTRTCAHKKQRWLLPVIREFDKVTKPPDQQSGPWRAC